MSGTRSIWEVIAAEVPLKQTEKAQLFAEKTQARLYRFTDANVNVEAFNGWSRPVQLRFVRRGDVYDVEARDWAGNP